MKSRNWPYVYGTILLIHLLSIAFHQDLLRTITKPLMMICLGIWFYSSSQGSWNGCRLIMAALGFSLLGDVFLMMDSINANWFIAGIAAFLLAHFMYIVFFVRLRRMRSPKPKIRPLWIAIAVIYSAMLVMLVYPHTGSLGIPVVIYAATITAMLVSVILACGVHEKAGFYCLGAAILFVASDSMLAINKFYQSFSLASLLIMFTYGCAQFGFVKGCLQYLAEIKYSPAKS